MGTCCLRPWGAGSADSIQVLAPSGSAVPQAGGVQGLIEMGLKGPAVSTQEGTTPNSAPSQALELAEPLLANIAVLRSHLSILLPPTSVHRCWSLPSILYPKLPLSVCFREASWQHQAFSWTSSFRRSGASPDYLQTLLWAIEIWQQTTWGPRLEMSTCMSKMMQSHENGQGGSQRVTWG